MPVVARAVDAVEAARVLRTAASVSVLAHVHPDADTLGSAFALALALDRSGAVVRVSFPAPHAVPRSLGALPGSGYLVEPERVPASDDVVVVVDCSSLDRVGELSDRIAGAGTTLVLDHHRTYSGFGDLALVDTDAQSTATIAADVLAAWGVRIDADIAQCLYAGLATDTGGLRRADARSLRLAADLLDTGFDGAELLRSLMDSHPVAWLSMLATVLARVELDPAAAGGRGLVHTVVRGEDATGLEFEEVEAVIDIVRTADEAEVAAVLKQQGGGHRWAVSMRSRGAVDVAAVARSLGGGGHRAAAGYTADGTAADVVDELRARLG